MAEITFRKIVDEIETLHDAPYKQILMTAGAVTGNGAGAASTIVIGIIPYRSWRVIDTGFVVEVAGASTVAETLSFGFAECDMGAVDVDYFGTFSQDITAGEDVSAGDMYQQVNYSYLKTPDTPAQAGTAGWTAGSPDGFLQWQSKQGLITVTKNLVALSEFTARGWVLVEIGEV